MIYSWTSGTRQVCLNALALCNALALSLALILVFSIWLITQTRPLSWASPHSFRLTESLSGRRTKRKSSKR